MADPEERARCAFAVFLNVRALQREERTRQVVASIRDNSYKGPMLKVTWEKGAGDYTSTELRSIFKKFGVVRDVTIWSYYEEKGTAAIIMASKDAAASAIGKVLGDPSNPLQVSLLRPFDIAAMKRKLAAFGSEHIFSCQYRQHEDYVLKKFLKAGKRQRRE